ncbi:type II CRISPR RNA-guided endonuclease Cas9 [Roseivirga thermotolerans]|uniref:CRISPR-associated endonuclease Cas9 n=1 Tax=Roseivirga thermotolerans TaxID=1758176 RepID=A0ABQ3I563_9BACT|nr:type II CRISPR RNA-guided endonuclease Cas9 [Roseivirga thermotolerans]GHE54579.1 hypothetical protein GCM10011340_06520 [Roseivirga thermotolerans]
MKRILGLDLGTNSIGWSLVRLDYQTKKDTYLGSGEILGMGSRIIPMNEAALSDFGKGKTVSQTAERTKYRGIRRLRQRHLLRRERLHRILNILGFLPKHYAQEIDFDNRLGQFLDHREPKVAYRKNKNQKYEFLFKSSFDEMIQDFKKSQPSLFYKKDSGEETKIPYDWTIYYLRKKGLSEKLTKEELAWVILNFNQKRGYYQLRGDEIDTEKTKQTRQYFITETITSIVDTEQIYKGLSIFQISLSNGEVGKYYSKKRPSWIGEEKNIIVTVELDKDGKDRLNDHGEVKRKFTIPSEEDWDKKWPLIKAKTEDDLKTSGKTVGCYIYDKLLQKPNQKIRGKLVRTIERDFYKYEFSSILKKQVGLQPELFTDELFEACVKHLYPNNIPHQTDLLKRGFVHLFTEDIIFYQRPLKTKRSLIAECKYENRVYKDKETGEEKKQWLKCIATSHPLYQEFRLWQFVQNLKIYEREKRVNGLLHADEHVTNEFISSIEDKVKLFEQLNDRKNIKQSTFLGFFKKDGKKLTEKTHRWNYVEDKEYPCNETRAGFITVLKKNKEFNWQEFLTQKVEVELWHTLYSINKKNELKSALEKLAKRLNVEDDILKPFLDFPPFKKEYGAFSFKALNKLLPLLRSGNHWSEEQIHEKVKDRIDKILTGEEDDSVDNKIRERLQSFNSIEDFQGLPIWLASYVAYGRHSEVGERIYWKKPSDIERLAQHSLRNPIVEQVINETLQVVKDIWNHYGNGEEKFFDEIHVELGRDIKNTKKERERLTKQITENQNTNLRIRAILKELMDDPKVEGDVKDYSPSQQELLKIYEEGVLTASAKLPDDIEKISRKAEPTKTEIQKYRLWMDQKYRSPYTGEMIPLNKLFTPAYEIEHILPQSRYFDDSLNNKVICEAVVNGNPYKDNQTGYEFISKNEGRIVHELSTTQKTVKIFTKLEYESFVSRYFTGKKKAILLMPDIPESFTNRQLNDSRYISKVVMKLMSNLVREENEEEATSKHVIPVTGKVTAQLRKDWGFNDVWNELIAPRFQRMNELTGTNDFGYWDEKGGNKFFRNNVPDELKKNFDPKRIDHRHHALDALVVALADRRHVNYLNNKHAQERGKERKDYRANLCFRKYDDSGKNYNWTFYKPWESITKELKDKLATTVVSVKQNKRILTKTSNYYESFKDEMGSLRRDKSGLPKKGLTKQLDGKQGSDNKRNISLRKDYHDPMPYGKIELAFDVLNIYDALNKRDYIIDEAIRNQVIRLISYYDGKETLASKESKKHFKQYKKAKADLDKFQSKIDKLNLEEEPDQKEISSLTKRIVEKEEEVLHIKETLIIDKTGNAIDKTHYQIKTEKYGKRQPLAKALSGETYDAVVKSIFKVADYQLQLDLIDHLNSYYSEGNLDFAFSPDGIDRFNRNRKTPIYSVRLAESGSSRFELGEKKGNNHKYVEATTGNNIYFAVYKNRESGERKFETIPLRESFERLKQGEKTPAPRLNKDGYKLLFTLSPGEVVFVPDEEEKENIERVDFSNLTKSQIGRLFTVNDFSGYTIYFTPTSFARAIGPKELDTSYDHKLSKVVLGDQSVPIKDHCWKLEVDRLGNLKRAR